jgi:hypothetical protein
MIYSLVYRATTIFAGVAITISCMVAKVQIFCGVVVETMFWLVAQVTIAFL